jgi:hypothetical protein
MALNDLNRPGPNQENPIPMWRLKGKNVGPVGTAYPKEQVTSENYGA